jgi:lipopolysaccharide export system protein LptC
VSENRITGNYGFSRAALEARRLLMFANLTRYTCFVKFSKLSLIVLLLVLFAVIIIFPMMEKDQAGVRVAFSNVEKSDASIEKPYMKNPKFQGVDEQMQPYVVTADRAIQVDERTVEMQKVKADMSFKDGSWMMLNAARGILTMDAKEQSNKTLTLDGDISLYQDSGFELHAQKVIVDIATGFAHSEGRVDGLSPIGHVEAGGLKAWKADKRLVLDGGVKMIIVPQKDKK